MTERLLGSNDGEGWSIARLSLWLNNEVDDGMQSLLTLIALGQQDRVREELDQAQLAVETACLRQICGVKIGDGRRMGACV